MARNEEQQMDAYYNPIVLFLGEFWPAIVLGVGGGLVASAYILAIEVGVL